MFTFGGKSSLHLRWFKLLHLALNNYYIEGGVIYYINDIFITSTFGNTFRVVITLSGDTDVSGQNFPSAMRDVVFSSSNFFVFA